ncbi:hypothetical protein [Salisediminibacterium selenitireducens]|uniref:Uncharacterized protein n=1 Tax=Bacillus selenitireducens (strain ATCC 700615 / DSM 15326 / MLS10) TaxID=439292 RepID=D6XW05_BACIE|nr:hypothetical protein [Salisediminibacterium selenitireducens]ADH97778.1 hypothetical protein Bsel_0233 [[Bacillus] selenitireducens MLS10]
MIINFKRLLFGASTEPLTIKQNRYPAGKMSLEYHLPQDRPATSPVYDVHIELTDHTDTYTIIQDSVPVRDGHRWLVTENGTIASTKRLTEKHRISFRSRSLSVPLKLP